jgi:hypothetical protein
VIAPGLLSADREARGDPMPPVQPVSARAAAPAASVEIVVRASI